jgi:hypothetical protein
LLETHVALEHDVSVPDVSGHSRNGTVLPINRVRALKGLPPILEPSALDVVEKEEARFEVAFAKREELRLVAGSRNP